MTEGLSRIYTRARLGRPAVGTGAPKARPAMDPPGPEAAPFRMHHPPSGAPSPSTGVDALIRETAARQHGVVARAQLVRAGAPAHTVDFRLRRGNLRALHRGVYLAGPVAGPLHREWAALLACSGSTARNDHGGTPAERDGPFRPGLALSHRTAAAMWGLVPPVPGARAVDVSGPTTLRRRSGVRVHRVGPVDPAEVARKDGLPLTTPARALVELASEADTGELERAVARAFRMGVLTPEGLRETLVVHRRRPGGGVLTRLLERVEEPELTRSAAEARLLALVRRGGLPRPRVNAVVAGLEVDFLWSRPRLVVEVDGYAFHRGRAAFEGDRKRDQVLTAAGYRVVRVTWRQLESRPHQVLVRLAQALVGRR